jgi:hypothetical protein
MPIKNISTALTATSATAESPPGQQYEVFHPTYGEQVWIYIENLSGGALAAGDVVMHEGTRTFAVEKTSLSASANRVKGVAQHAIPSTYFGWILRKGEGALVKADTGGFTADTGIIPGDAVTGTADNASGVTVAVFGVARATTLATATGICGIDCKG